MEGITQSIFLEKNSFFAWMLPQIVLLPPLGHKEAIGTPAHSVLRPDATTKKRYDGKLFKFKKFSIK